MTEPTELGQVAARLKANCLSDNYVYVVGYSLERVHSGTLASLLRRSDENSKAIVAALWNLECGEQRTLAPNDIEVVAARQESALGPRCVADLLIELKVHGKTHRIIMEYKVDGTGDHRNQCIRTAECCEDDDLVYLATLGGAEFLDGPDRWGEAGRRIKTLRLDSAIQMLTPFVNSHRRVLADYLNALEDERLRRKHARTLGWERKDLGYRRFDGWYAVYDQMRQAMPSCLRAHWTIWSGTHNAVMNWRPAFDGDRKDPWEIPGIGRLYIEVRGDRMTGCVLWCKEAQGNRSSAQRLASIVGGHLSGLPGLSDSWKPTSRIATPKTYGTWGSVRILLDETAASYLSEIVEVQFPAFCDRVRRSAMSE